MAATGVAAPPDPEFVVAVAPDPPTSSGFVDAVGTADEGTFARTLFVVSASAMKKMVRKRRIDGIDLYGVRVFARNKSECFYFTISVSVYTQTSGLVRFTTNTTFLDDTCTVPASTSGGKRDSCTSDTPLTTMEYDDCAGLMFALKSKP